VRRAYACDMSFGRLELDMTRTRSNRSWSGMAGSPCGLHSRVTAANIPTGRHVDGVYAEGTAFNSEKEASDFAQKQALYNVRITRRV
jgi:hypothetical protein